MSLSADDARSVEFGTAPIGRRGYAKDEVDAFVERIARTIEAEDDLTAAEVHHVMFGKPLIGKRGYDERQVDEFLDAAEEALLSRIGKEWAYRVPPSRDPAEATAARAAAPAMDADLDLYQEK